MHTIIHGSFFPSTEEEKVKLEEAIQRFAEVKKENFALYGKYNDAKANGQVHNAGSGKNKGQPVTAQTWTEKQTKLAFPNFDKNFVHSAFMDNSKLIKRFYDRDLRIIPRWCKKGSIEIVRSNQLYFEGSKTSGNPCAKIDLNTGIIEISTGEGKATFFTNTNPKVLSDILKNKYDVIQKEF